MLVSLGSDITFHAWTETHNEVYQPSRLRNVKELCDHEEEESMDFWKQLVIPKQNFVGQERVH